MLTAWRLRLRYFWIEHRIGIGVVLGAAIVTGLFCAASLIEGWFQPRSLSSTPPIATSTVGTIIGFAGEDWKYSPDVFVYVRTFENAFGIARLPFYSGCHTGDRIFLTQWQVGGQLHFRVRPPGCSRNPPGAAG